MNKLVDLDKCSLVVSAPYDAFDPQDPVRKYIEETFGIFVKAYTLVDGMTVTIYEKKQLHQDCTGIAPTSKE